MISSYRIDQLADQFEEAWNSGKRISADTFLADHFGKAGMEGSPKLLQELLEELRIVEQELERKYQLTEEVHSNAMLKRIGNYEFLEGIGRGGMGELYRARHVLLDKIVAVKVLPEAIAGDSQAVKRFERELKLLGTLSHPNIVQAYGAEQIQGQLLLVMEYIDGENLQQSIAAGKKIAVDDAMAIIRQVAAGLQYAHERKVIHRDIKPANIMLSQDGVAKILDFGLGKFYDDMLLMGQEDQSGPLTKLGSPLGTLDYLSPEQWDNPGSVDIRADIYGLGCTFYTIVVGEVPYPANRFRSIREKMAAHLQQSLTPFSAHGIAASPAAEAILRKMCAKDRDQRFASPQELIDAIDEYERNKETILPSPFRRWGRRIAVVAAVLASLGLVLLFIPSPFEREKNVPSPSGGGLGWGHSVNQVSPHPSPPPRGGGDENVDPPRGEGTQNTPPPTKDVLKARYGGDLRTARRLCREWLDEVERDLPATPQDTPQTQESLAEIKELFADCTLYGNDPNIRGYEFYVEEAETLYRDAMVLTENTEKKSILNSKRAILQMVNGQPFEGLRNLETGISLITLEKYTETSRCTHFFEVAKGIGGFFASETQEQRQASLLRVLDMFRLQNPSAAPAQDILFRQERFDIQLLCIRLLLESGLKSGDMEATQRNVGRYLSPLLLGILAGDRELRPYLRKDYDLAIRCCPDDALRQAEYIFCQRMDDTPREGMAQLIFYFTSQGGFALFLPSDLSEGVRFDLHWTRDDLLNNRINPQRDRSDFVLHAQLVALVQAEWAVDRRVALSWNDEICFADRNEGLSFDDWCFESQLKLELFVGIKK